MNFIFENILEAILVMDSQCKVLTANSAAQELFGYPEKELYTKYGYDLFDTHDPAWAGFRKDFVDQGKASCEMTLVRNNGEKFPCYVSSCKFKDKNGLDRISMLVKDISQRKEAEQELKYSRKMYQNLFENAQIGIFRVKMPENKLLAVNKKLTELVGYTKEEMLNACAPYDWSFPEEGVCLMAELENCHLISDREISFKHKNGETRSGLLSLQLYSEEGYAEGTVQDITQRKKLEKELKESVLEKDLLVKEMNHRIKNNLMVISSLLDLQSRYIKDEKSLEFFKESQCRAKAMALLHARLYSASDLKRINFGEYIETLAKDVFHTYATSKTAIDLKIKVEDQMLDVDIVVPLGLIVNELVSNCMKHAFTPGKRGDINLEFYKNQDEYILRVRDNGIGFPEDLDVYNTDTLGLQLLTSLTSQIGGDLKFENDKGAVFEVSFKDNGVEKPNN